MTHPIKGKLENATGSSINRRTLLGAALGATAIGFTVTPTASSDDETREKKLILILKISTRPSSVVFRWS